MGDVYEAIDLELGTPVALKAIRAEIADDERVVRRFQREIVLARQVTHPNVCRLFDLCRHRGPGAPAGGVLLLAMEFVPGETLLARLRRAGPLSPDELLPLARQIAAGLQAAHRAGVVHRDLKSSNIIVSPAGHQGGGARAVITDFGLACHLHGERSSLDEGALIGTANYMAPEQVEGGPITPAVDVYAFGVVLYELLTGAAPFEGETTLAVALRRLTRPPTPPRSHRPDLDPRWEAVLLRCLEREPARRFANVEEIPASLEASGADTRARRASRTRLVGVLALGATLAVALYLWRADGTTPPPNLPSPASLPRVPRATYPTQRRGLAVLGFRDLVGRGEDAWIGVALAELLTTDLAASDGWRTVPGTAVAALRSGAARGLPAAELTPAALARTSRALAADVLVSGAYLRFGALGHQLRVDVRVHDASNGEELAALAERGSTDDLPELSARVAAALRTRLGARSPARTVDDRAAPLPLDPLAARAYARALERMRANDWAAATRLLQQVVARDGRHAPTWLALYQCWSELGYERKARSAAQRAFDLSDGLGVDLRLRIVGAYHTALHEHDRAVATYRLLWEHYPDDLGHGLLLARSCVRAGDTREALEVLAGLRRLPAPQNVHPEIDVVEALVAQALSDFARQRAAARRAAAAAEGLGVDALVAEARYLEGWAQLKLGVPSAAARAFDEAQRRFALTGNSVARALVLSSLGVVARTQGRLGAALRDHEAALHGLQQAGHQSGAASTAMNIGVLLEALGRPQAARRRYHEARAIQREIGDRRGLLRTLVKSAALELAAGDVASSAAACDESARVARDAGEPSLVALGLACAGDVLLARDDLVGASARYREALELAQRTRERPGAALMRLALARVALEDGRYSAAVSGAASAEQELGVSQRRDEQVLAAAVVVRAQLALAQWAAAREAARRADELARSSERQDTRLTALLAGARVAFADGRLTQAQATLLRGLEQARGAGDRAGEREARLILAELRVAQGQRDAGCADARALVREASAAGLGLLARRARLPTCSSTPVTDPAGIKPKATPGA